MPSRPIWKGQIRLSLVAIPVELHSASKTGAQLAFRQIHAPSGKPVRYEKIVEGVGPVDTDDIMKGFEYERDNYVLLTDEEIDAVRLETRKTIELSQFVGACEIDPVYYNKPYFVVPQDELAEDAYRVLRDALRATEKIGLGQLAMRGREYLVALKPAGTGLLLETLHYEDEIRKSDKFFSSLGKQKSEEDLLAVAKQLIERKTARFDAGTFEDHYRQALRELVRRKLKSKGRKIVTTEDEPEPGRGGDNVIDLMSALKSSLRRSGGRASERRRPAQSRRSGSHRRRAG